MSKLFLEKMEFFAYHGHFKEEQIIGTRFLVDLEIDFDGSLAEKSDHLQDTINYQAVYKVIKTEMEQKSHLLEHVALRIREALVQQFPLIHEIRIKVSKMNPSLGGKVGSVSYLSEKKI